LKVKRELSDVANTVAQVFTFKSLVSQTEPVLFPVPYGEQGFTLSDLLKAYECLDDVTRVIQENPMTK